MNFVHWGTNNKYHGVLLGPFNMKTNYVVWDAIMEFDAGLKPLLVPLFVNFKD